MSDRKEVSIVGEIYTTPTSNEPVNNPEEYDEGWMETGAGRVKVRYKRDSHTHCSWKRVKNS